METYLTFFQRIYVVCLTVKEKLLRKIRMTPDQYQSLCERTECNQNASAMRFGENGLKAIRFNHSVIGINAEGGELATQLQRWLYYGKPLDETNVKEELGDLLWYIAEACNAMGYSLETIMEANIAKLKIRYPEKYTDVLADEANRDRAKEAGAVSKVGRVVKRGGPNPFDDGVSYECR